MLHGKITPGMGAAAGFRYNGGMKMILVAALCTSAALAASAANPVAIRLGDAKDGHAVPESLWGIFRSD